MKVLAGDWPKGIDVKIMFGQIMFQKTMFKSDTIFLHQIEQFDIVTENNHASIVGKIGWGAAGGLLLGPVGLLAGVLGGGNKKERVMSIKFMDGRQALLKGSVKDAEKLTVATYK